MKRLGLNPHVVNVLRRANIENLQDLLEAQPEKLGRIPGMGQTRLGELLGAVCLYLGGNTQALRQEAVKTRLIEMHEAELALLKERRERVSREIARRLHAIAALRLAS